MWEAKLRPDAICYNAGISACGKGEQWQRAFALLSEMWESKLETGSATALGSARARRASSGRWVWRFSARCGRRSWSPTSFSCNAGISACEKGGQWQRGLALLSEMRGAKLEPSVISYNAGISACVKGDQWQRALALFSEMPEAKLKPTVVSYHAGISACGNGEQWQRALALLGEMWGARLEPSAITYNMGISACEKGEQWQQAVGLLSEMREATLKPDVIFSYNACISACGKGDQWQRALALLSETREAKLKPDVTSSAATLASARARKAGCGSGLWRCSARWGRRILSPTQSATPLGSARAVRALSGSGLWPCSARCGRRSWSPVHTSQLQRWDQRVREGRAVAASCGAAQRDAGGKGGARRLSYNAGISACEKGEQWQPVLALLSEMRLVKLEPNTIATTLPSARARRSCSGNGLCCYSARCGR
ncbi:unnamed protein product [Prorocentrum cordatum]|uniref:Pentatricopeptide repeat-containing protein, chloroplastic n=1 Tax=Prorocentrum cordatum TaxID=2364126 RepID=A0ABN9U2F9_9DINO|nr:unnamed protein product [Polarella glacialis]